MAKQMARTKPSEMKKKTDIKVPHISAIKRNQIVREIIECSDEDIMDILRRVGVGERFFTCYMCGEIRKAKDFYTSTDPNVHTGMVRICRDCCDKIVYQRDEYGNTSPPTKQTAMKALEYMDKPFVDNVYDSSVAESESQAQLGRNKDFWRCYTSRINSNTKYAMMRWRDSDGFNRTYRAAEEGLPEKVFEVATPADQMQENQERYEINKADVIKFVGYDCFADEPEADKPRLYAQLVGFLDDSAKEDPFKLNSIIQIVKALNQAEALNTTIAVLMSDKRQMLENQASINKILDSRSKCLNSATQLAKDNGISQIYNTSKSQGSQTLSGRIKKVTEENLREGKANFFSIGTARGMQQVADISALACAKAIGLNEDIVREINSISREQVTAAIKQRDEYHEKYRILLQENVDLKNYLRDKGLIDESSVAIDGVPEQIGGDATT